MQEKRKKIHAVKIWNAGLLLAVLLVLAGCTKKEELLFLDEEGVLAGSEADRTAELQSGEGVPPAGEDASTTAAPSAEEIQSTSGEEISGADTASDENQGMIYVHVCGAVRQSGVYELKAGSRVYEAVQAAGGFAEGADQNYVNQAQELSDGVKLVIPTLEEAAAVREAELSTGAVQENTTNAGAGDTKSAAPQIGIVNDSIFAESKDTEQAQDSSGKININTASEAQLCDIPGIGATRAAAIAAYRETHGGFQKPEDIMKVSGIKEGMYEKIKDSISVN